MTYTEKTLFPIPFTLNGIWSWWQFSYQFWTKWTFIWIKIERKTFPTIISYSMWKEMERQFSLRGHISQSCILYEGTWAYIRRNVIQKQSAPTKHRQLYCNIYHVHVYLYLIYIIYLYYIYALYKQYIPRKPKNMQSEKRQVFSSENNPHQQKHWQLNYNIYHEHVY